jgi:hypothetical protein
VLVLALGLRLWGVGQGLPYVYNTDEDTLFMPHAIAMFAEGLNPHYFENPAAFTYFLHLLLLARFGASGARQIAHELEAGTVPAATIHTVYVLGRVFVALLGTLTLWLLYLTGARLFSRAVGLLAAAILAVAFLPVFYSHLALNDVPTLAPLTLSLFGTAGVLRRGRPLDYVLAGLGLGLAAGTKYTGGIVIVPLLAAFVADYRTPQGRRTAPLALALAGVTALAAFIATNPYSILAFHEFHSGLAEQSSRSAQGKLGAPAGGGLRYYLWSFTWGLGWVPSLAALGGALTVWRYDRRVAWVLVPTVVAFLIFMGLETRYFGRWVLPIFPIACLLAAQFALALHGLAMGALKRRHAARAGDRAPSRWLRALGAGFACLIVLALIWQGLVYSIHSDRVLSRPYTAALARDWMLAHVPAGTPILLEPVVPNAWAEDPPYSRRPWYKVPDQRYLLEPDGREIPPPGRYVIVENYEHTLTPALIPYYERRGICVVVSGSTQRDRAFADPRAVPGAIAYYHALAADSSVVYRVSPYRSGSRPVDFNFDWSFDYYPLSYVLPGPEITIYRLRGGACARRSNGSDPTQGYP